MAAIDTAIEPVIGAMSESVTEATIEASTESVIEATMEEVSVQLGVPGRAIDQTEPINKPMTGETSVPGERSVRSSRGPSQ